MKTKETAERFSPNKEELSKEKLKTFPGCENYSDQEAEEIVLSIQILCALIFDEANSDKDLNQYIPLKKIKGDLEKNTTVYNLNEKQAA